MPETERTDERFSRVCDNKTVWDRNTAREYVALLHQRCRCCELPGTCPRCARIEEIERARPLIYDTFAEVSNG